MRWPITTYTEDDGYRDGWVDVQLIPWRVREWLLDALETASIALVLGTVIVFWAERLGWL